MFPAVTLLKSNIYCTYFNVCYVWDIVVCSYQSKTLKCFSDISCGNKGNAPSCSQCPVLYGSSDSFLDEACDHDCLWTFETSVPEDKYACTERGDISK